MARPSKLVLTYAEAGEVLGVSASTIRRMVLAGEIRTVRWHNRLVRVPVKTLHEDIERMTGPAVERPSDGTDTATPGLSRRAS